MHTNRCVAPARRAAHQRWLVSIGNRFVGAMSTLVKLVNSRGGSVLHDTRRCVAKPPLVAGGIGWPLVTRCRLVDGGLAGCQSRVPIAIVVVTYGAAPAAPNTRHATVRFASDCTSGSVTVTTMPNGSPMSCPAGETDTVAVGTVVIVTVSAP